MFDDLTLFPIHDTLTQLIYRFKKKAYFEGDSSDDDIASIGRESGASIGLLMIAVSYYRLFNSSALHIYVSFIRRYCYFLSIFRIIDNS